MVFRGVANPLTLNWIDKEVEFVSANCPNNLCEKTGDNTMDVIIRNNAEKSIQIAVITQKYGRQKVDTIVVPIEFFPIEYPFLGDVKIAGDPIFIGKENLLKSEFSMKIPGVKNFPPFIVQGFTLLKNNGHTLFSDDGLFSQDMKSYIKKLNASDRIIIKDLEILYPDGGTRVQQLVKIYINK